MRTKLSGYFYIALVALAFALLPVAARADATPPTESSVFSTSTTGLHDALLGYVGTAMPVILSLSALLIGIGMMFMWFKKKSKSS